MPPLDFHEMENRASDEHNIFANFSYLGVCMRVNLDSIKFNNEDLMLMLMEVFSLPPEYKNALILKHANGTLYDVETLKNQLHLFPTSSNIIFIRIDPTKINANEAVPTHRKHPSNVISKVFRQNCFLIASPPSITNRKRHNTPEQDSPPVKRRRLLIHSKKPKNPDKKDNMRI